ncbi:hypothetical protein PR001_g31578, partial [Phytophthora rubi]
MRGAECHSGARKWRACSHRTPRKQTKGDGRGTRGPAKGQHDQYRNVAAERKLRTRSKQSSVGAPRLMVACMICYSAAQQQVAASKPRMPNCGHPTAAAEKLVAAFKPRMLSCGCPAA